MRRLYPALAAGLFTLAAPLAAQAQFGLPKLPAGLPGVPTQPVQQALGRGPYAQAHSLNEAKTIFLSAYFKARGETNAAQTLLAIALGLKDEADALKNEAKALSSGSLDVDAYAKSQEISDRCDGAIRQKLAEGAVLDADGQAAFSAALPHFIKGTAALMALVETTAPTVAALKGDVSSVSPLNAAANGASLMFFGKVLVDLPRLFAAQIETLKAAIAYGSSHGIKPPADATALLK